MKQGTLVSFLAFYIWAIALVIVHGLRAHAAEPRISALQTIRENCLKCHSGEKPPNGLRLDSVDNMVRGGKSGPALVPFQPDQSLLYKYITPREGAGPKMPPFYPLTEAQQAAVRAWIAAGALQYSMGGQEP